MTGIDLLDAMEKGLNPSQLVNGNSQHSRLSQEGILPTILGIPDIPVIPTTLYVVLDRSGSMWGKPVVEGYRELLQEHKTLATDHEDYRFTLVTFADEMIVEIENQNIKDVSEEIRYVPGGMTNLWNTLWKVLEMVSDPSRRHILFVLTDGENTVDTPYSTDDISREVERKKATGIDINIVWIGSNGGQGLGNHVGGNEHTTLDFDDAYMLQAIRSGSGAVRRYVSGGTETIEFTDLERDISMGGRQRHCSDSTIDLNRYRFTDGFGTTTSSPDNFILDQAWIDWAGGRGGGGGGAGSGYNRRIIPEQSSVDHGTNDGINDGTNDGRMYLHLDHV